MTNTRNNERFVPTKNYIIAVVVVVVIIALTWYAFEWYKVFNENKISSSYLVKEKVITKEITSLNEVSDVFSEAPNTYFVYVSYTGAEEVYNMEKDLKSLIVDYGLNDYIYYLNVTSIKNEKDCLEQVNKALRLEEQKITSIPTIIYYNDNKVIDIVKREDDNIMNAGDFQKLLDVNNIAKE